MFYVSMSISQQYSILYYYKMFEGFKDLEIYFFCLNKCYCLSKSYNILLTCKK